MKERNTVLTRLSRRQLFDVARWLHGDLNLSIVPVDRNKKPLVEWKEFQERKPTWELVRKWINELYDRGLVGFAVVCGIASGRLLGLGFEHEDAYRWFLQQLPDDLRYLLENTLTVLSGRRPDGKRGVHVYVRLLEECDKSPRNMDVTLPVEVKVENWSVTGKKEPPNRLEVKWTGKYFVGPGAVHPSGVIYQVLVGPESTPEFVRAEGFRVVRFPPTGIKVLNCDEVRRLLEVIERLAQKTDVNIRVVTLEEKETGRPWRSTRVVVEGEGGRKLVFTRELTDDQILKVIEVFKKHNLYVEGYRDYIHLYLQGWLLKLRYAPDSIKELSRRLADEFNDEELEHRVKLVDYQVKWLLSGKPLDKQDIEVLKQLGIRSQLVEQGRTIGGKAKLIEVFAQILREQGYGENEAQAKAIAVVHELAQILDPRTARKLLIPISVFGRLSGQNRITYIANDPVRGIALVHKILPSEGKVEKCVREVCKEVNDEEKDRCRQESYERCVEKLTRWGYDKLLPDWYITNVRSVYDLLTKSELYYVVFRRCRSRIRKDYAWVLKEELLSRVKRELGWAVSREALDSALTIILREYSRKIDKTYGVIGVVPDGENVKVSYIGPRGELLRKFLEEQDNVDPRDAASVFMSFIRKWYSQCGKVLQVVAIGLFQVLNFVRTVHNRRNAILVLYGAPRTGKSTIARYIIGEMLGGPDLVEIHSASIFESAARIARVVTSSTFPVIIDDVDFRERSYLVETLKNIVTLGIAREWARPYQRELERLPAVSGMIITCNRFEHPTDPGLQDRIVAIAFTVEEQKTNHTEFNSELLRIREHLRTLGRAYIKYIVEHWNEVKDTVLQDNYISAALDLFRKFMERLGVEIDYGDPEAKLVSEDTYVDDLDRFRIEIYRILERYSSGILVRRGLVGTDGDVEDAIYGVLMDIVKSNVAAPYGIKYIATDNTVFISSDLIRKTLGTTIRNVVEKFRKIGIDAHEAKERITVNRKATYPRGVKVPLEQFLNWILRKSSEDEYNVQEIGQ